MINNSNLLQQLLAKGQIALENAAFLTQSPVALPDDWGYERVEGMLLGLAIGDALGNTTESQLPVSRQKSNGEIRDYLSNQYADNRQVGLPSDDTQMAFWTLEQQLEDGELVPGHLATKFTRSQIYGIGNTVRDFLRAYQKEGKPWEQAGQSSAGNGALMRIAPALIPHLRQPSPALWADAALVGMVTHNDRASITCCVAFTHLLWECLSLKTTPDPIWWIETFTETARQLEGETHYSPRNQNIKYDGPLCRFVDEQVRLAIQENWSIRDACDRWYSGAYLLETMPCVLYILARHAENPEEAIIRAVNDTKDNDTIAAIVGAAVGALHGRQGIPARWITNLLGRTGSDDNWRIFELIESAKQTFWQADPPLSRADIQAILDFLPIFEQPGFKAGEEVWKEGQFPFYNFAPEIGRFLEALYAHKFILVFDWMSWVEGQQFLEHPELLQQANLQTLRKLLTAYVRADRFTDGYLAMTFDKGQIVRILKRMSEIQSTGE